MLQHISEPLAELLGQRPKSVDTERIEQAIRNDGGIMFLAETVEEILEDLKRTRRECEALRAENERLKKGGVE